MNKFLIYDESLGIYRLPLSYSFGDLDQIRNMFGEHSRDASIALPKLPPLRDTIDAENRMGYLVYPPSELAGRITDFLEKTTQHVRELKGKGYDYEHPLFKNYLKAREDLVSYLAGRLETTVDQERRLGIFNIFWLGITKMMVASLDEVLIRNSGNQRLRFAIHPHLKSMLKQVLDQVYEKLEFQDSKRRQEIPFHRGTLKSKMGANFNFNFVTDVLNVQLSLLQNYISPLDPLYEIRKILVEENSEYYLNYKDFTLFYESIRFYITDAIEHKDEWVGAILSQIIGLSVDKLDKLNINCILFDPLVIYTLQETFRSIPAHGQGKHISFRKNTLLEAIGLKIWNQVLLDYIKLARELQKTEIITFFRDRIMLLGPEFIRAKNEQDDVSGLEGRITYDFDGRTIVNDLRRVTLLFIDLRGFTEISAGLISTNKLKKALYEFFDPTLDIIEHFKGQIKFFAGDAVLAIFGEVSKSDERTLNAIRTGILINRMLRHLLNERIVPFEGVGVGIHVGQIENAYIFKDDQQKIDTIIGLPANITSRLSSGKSTSAERKGDPILVRELKDTLQDVLEQIKGKVAPNLRGQVVSVFEHKIARFSGDRSGTESYLTLPESKAQPGQFKVNIVGGMLNNNGIAVSEEAFNEIRAHHDLRSRPRGDEIEFAMSDPILQEDIIFWRVGDAVLKGIDGTTSVWAVRPAAGQ